PVAAIVAAGWARVWFWWDWTRRSRVVHERPEHSPAGPRCGEHAGRRTVLNTSRRTEGLEELGEVVPEGGRVRSVELPIGACHRVRQCGAVRPAGFDAIWACVHVADDGVGCHLRPDLDARLDVFGDIDDSSAG